MSVELLERAAQALEPVLGEVVFLGGASIVLWITDPAAPAPRPTEDVDVVIEVTSRAAFHARSSSAKSSDPSRTCAPTSPTSSASLICYRYISFKWK
ncbi:MAG TPA: hypothetical protein VIH71_18075 [Solirubrobacteraceae bacterium]